MLAKHLASPALVNAQLTTDMINAGPTASRAEKFRIAQTSDAAVTAKADGTKEDRHHRQQQLHIVSPGRVNVRPLGRSRTVPIRTITPWQPQRRTRR